MTQEPMDFAQAVNSLSGPTSSSDLRFPIAEVLAGARINRLKLV